MILSLTILSAGLYFMPGSTINQRFRTGFTQAHAFFNGKGTGPYVVRLAMWTEAWKMFKKSPVCGTGKDGYNDIIEAKAAQNEVPEAIEKFYSPHNNYLTNMAAYGVTGLFIILAIFLSPLFIFIPAVRKKGPQKDMAYTGIMLIVSFMLFAVTETIFYRNINISVYMILTAAILSMSRHYYHHSRDI
jgi:O-antigen ligase